MKIRGMLCHKVLTILSTIRLLMEPKWWELNHDMLSLTALHKEVLHLLCRPSRPILRRYKLYTDLTPLTFNQ
ncbi:hypothetical protein ACOMHN_018337 [Nucella lapillus]